MAKFIDVKDYLQVENDYDIVVAETILLNVENIKWIKLEKYSSGYAIRVVTDKNCYVYDCFFERENEAYEKMFELQRELNK